MRKARSKTRRAGAAGLDEQAAREKCLRLLAIRARSAAELRDGMRGVGFGEGVMEAVLLGLERAGLVDDEEFARSWVASRQPSGRSGRRKLRWELRSKGLSEDAIRRAVDEGIDDEMEVRAAMEVVRRRLRGRRAAEQDTARLRRLLVGRGFEFETVSTVLGRMAEEEEHS